MNTGERQPVYGEEERIVAAIRKIIRAVDLHSRTLFQSYGLTAPQLMALREVVRLEHTSPALLAKAIHVSRPTLTGILDRLESRDLVTRQRSGGDRRSIVVAATFEGKQLVAESPSLLQDTFRQRLADLREWERHMLLATLSRLADMMDATGLDASPVLSNFSELEDDPRNVERPSEQFQEP